MVKERKLAVPNTTIFIAQLSAGTRNIIRKDLEQHARENGYHLDWDWEAKDYVGMKRVTEWFKEREELMNVNKVRLHRRKKMIKIRERI